MLTVVGTLDIIYGIAAISESKFFVNDTTFVFSSLNTWGWITLVIGGVQLIAAFSLFSGGGFGRWVGIFGASLSAIAALLAIPASPFWALCVFALAIIVLYELAKTPETA